jgi:peptidoglycan/xylan/chitin deacetylase (PgdA/CDA1 family)
LGALDLLTFIRGPRQPNAQPDRSVLLTFDDGYRSMTDMSIDVLQQFGFPGVVFVPTDFIGKTNSFDREVEPEEAICDWSDLRALEEAGIHVESHGASASKIFGTECS